jgi:DNA-binding MarR family transcriptional regulator
VSSSPLRHTAAPQDHPHIEVFTTISAIEHYLRRTVIRHLPAGMTYAHFEVLRYFMRHGDGLTPAQLSQVLLVTKGAVTNILQKMEDQELIAVISDTSDGRKKRIRVTRTGIETANALFKAMKAQTEKLRDGFTDNEFRQALPFLKALGAFLAEETAAG